MMKPVKDSFDLGVVVGDIKASLNFYQNLLGLEFDGEVDVWFGKIYRLRFGSSVLKLIETPTPPSKGIIVLEKQLGFRYITFFIKNISELCAELQSKGVEFALPEKEMRPGVRIAMAKDPDGNIVEFVQR